MAKKRHPGSRLQLLPCTLEPEFQLSVHPLNCPPHCAANQNPKPIERTPSCTSRCQSFSVTGPVAGSTGSASCQVKDYNCLEISLSQIILKFNQNLQRDDISTFSGVLNEQVASALWHGLAVRRFGPRFGLKPRAFIHLNCEFLLWELRGGPVRLPA